MLPLQHTKQTYVIQTLCVYFTFSVFGLTLPSLPYFFLSNFDQIIVGLKETQWKVMHEGRKLIDFLDTLYTPDLKIDSVLVYQSGLLIGDNRFNNL